MTKPNAVTEKTCLAMVEDVTLQALGLGEGGVLLNMKTGEMFSINDTTFEFLSRLDGIKSVSDITDDLLNIFEVNRKTLAADILEIAEELQKENLLARN